MSGRRFLLSLKEVLNSGRILSCRPVTKENINFWKEDLQADQNKNAVTVLDEMFHYQSDDIIVCVLDNNSAEISTTISGYIARKLTKRSKCEK